MGWFGKLLIVVLLAAGGMFALLRPSLKDMEKLGSPEDRMVKSYIILRNTVIPSAQKMAARWGDKVGVCHLSSPEVCAEFAQYIDNDAELIRDDRLTRTLEFINFGELQKGRWRAEFITRDEVKGGEEKLVRRWVVELNASKINQQIKELAEISNKGEMIVTAYAQEERPLRFVPAQFVGVSELVERFVTLKHSTFGDLDTTVQFWGSRGPLRQISAKSLYNDVLAPDLAKRIALMKIEGKERKVRIDKLKSTGGNKWQVEFTTFDDSPNREETKTQKWLSFLEIGFNRKGGIFPDEDELKSGLSVYFDGFANPSGFYVKSYKEVPVGGEDMDKPSLAKKNFNIKELVEGYVRLRHEIEPDLLEMQRRWGFSGGIRGMSSEEVFRNFYVGGLFLYDEFVREKKTRNIEILAINHLGAQVDEKGGDKWQARFITRDLNAKGEIIETRRWLISLRESLLKVVPANQEEREDASLLPERFIVHDYEGNSVVVPTDEKFSPVESFVREYIKKRCEVSGSAAVLERWRGDVVMMTAPEALSATDFPDNPLPERHLREVTVLAARNVVDNFWEVDFITRDRRIGDPSEPKAGRSWQVEVILDEKAKESFLAVKSFMVEKMDGKEWLTP